VLSEPAPVKTIEASLSSEQLEIIGQWISECSVSHSSCAAKSNYDLPTRLLAVHSNTIKLIHTADLDTNPRYAALSHNWGTHPFLKLTTKSLKSLMDSITPEDLTRTFRDAVSIARSLCIDYLWIDSLCIIQDSEADWETESASMASVYRGSTITIAASGAADGREGCFLGPRTHLGRVCVQEIIAGCIKAWDITNDYDSVHNLPLGWRAWALQERLLSPQVLHFAPKTIFWECRSGSASEFSPKIVMSEDPRNCIPAR